MPPMAIRIASLAVLLASPLLMAQTIDLSQRGPQIGARVPPIAGVDQFGRRQTLQSIYGSKGTMLVFFRSADW